jgi:hypothetical protein
MEDNALFTPWSLFFYSTNIFVIFALIRHLPQPA